MKQQLADLENGGIILGYQVRTFPFSPIREDEIH